MRFTSSSLLFHRRHFARDESEHDGLALRHEAQRLEVARTFVFVFEQEPVDLERVEHFLGDRIVAALGVPLAAVVAAAEMDRERHAGFFRRFETRVVGRERFVEQHVGIFAHLGFQPLAPLRIEIVAVARRVDLDVRHALLGEALDLAHHDRGDVVQADPTASDTRRR